MQKRQLIKTETREGRYGQPVTVETHTTRIPGLVIEVETGTMLETPVVLPGTHLRSQVTVRRVDEIKQRHWYRVLRGKLHAFTHIVMPDGKVRISARQYNGYIDMAFGCAWDHLHLVTLPTATVKMHVRVVGPSGDPATNRHGVCEAVSGLLDAPATHVERLEGINRDWWLVSLPAYVADVTRHEGHWEWTSENGYTLSAGLH